MGFPEMLVQMMCIHGYHVTIAAQMKQTVMVEFCSIINTGQSEPQEKLFHFGNLT